MRFKLGLLQDTATIEKQTAKEAAEAQVKRHKHEIPTVKTEAQTKADEATASKEKDKSKEKTKDASKSRPKIRPLSEAKAIDSGANFVSETFLLLVGVALIVGENWRQTRKASSRREDIAERLAELEEYEKSARRGMVDLEREVIKLRSREANNSTSQPRILPKNVWELEEKEEAEEKPEVQGWWSWIKTQTSGIGRKGSSAEASHKERAREEDEPEKISRKKPTRSLLGQRVTE